MNKRDLQNEKLTNFERDLLAAGKLPDAEIEEIIAAPQLFECVRANIEAEKSRRNAKSKIVFDLQNFQFWNWHTAGFGFAALAILILSAVFFLNFSPQKAPSEIAAEEKQPETVSIPKQPEPLPQNLEPQKNELQQQRTAATKKEAKFKNEFKPLTKPPKKRKASPPKFENQSNEPFIALTYAGNLADEESQIVRVEMTPARLLALGVAVQTENEYEKIKTDLLVGSDGVARAIRLVK